MTVLTTARLRLEPFDDAHLEGLHAIDTDPEVMRYITGRPETLDETLAAIERVKARWTDWGFSWWSFIELKSGEIVGAGCIQYLEGDPANPLEIGWRMRRDKWRQGLAFEAAVEMARFAFQTLGAAALSAVCQPENFASAALMKKLGMRHRGIERWYAKDWTVFEITRGEWEARMAGGILDAPDRHPGPANYPETGERILNGKSAMSATNRPNTTTSESSNAEPADRVSFNEAPSHLWIELVAYEMAQIAGGTGKKLFCRLPGPLMSALQARLSCGRVPAAAEDKRAYELVTQGPSELRWFVQRTSSICGLYFYDYVTFRILSSSDARLADRSVDSVRSSAPPPRRSAARSRTVFTITEGITREA
jgi:RimJ/RimL family protein N-acetyltransferase